jgi:GIY-YIG catalytic domain
MYLDQDLFSLPSTGIKNLEKLPTCPGIYFAIDNNNQILYVGQAKNISKRWKGKHHRLAELEKHHDNYPVRLAWFVWNDEDLLSAEHYYIKRYRPLMNGTPVPPTEIFPSEALFKKLMEEIRGLIVVYGFEPGTSVKLPKIHLHFNYENSGKNGFAATIQRFKENNKDRWRNLKSLKMSDRKYTVGWTTRPGSREHKRVSRLQRSFNNHWEIACNGVIVDITPIDEENYKSFRSSESSAVRILAGVKVRAFSSPSRADIDLQALGDDPIPLFWISTIQTTPVSTPRSTTTVNLFNIPT